MKRRTTSFRARLLATLNAQPQTALSLPDAANRFSVAYNTARTAAYSMRKAGELGPGPELRLPG